MTNVNLDVIFDNIADRLETSQTRKYMQLGLNTAARKTPG